MPRDQKVMTLLPPQWRRALKTSIKELFLLPKFDNSSPTVTREKRDLSKSYDYHVMTSLLPEVQYSMEPFK